MEPVIHSEADEPSFPPFVCPDHGLSLSAEGERLSCPRGHHFPIVGEIPRFVPEGNYADHFGAQWKRYRLTQLDSHSGTTITETRAKKAIGDALWGSLEGSQMLEVGCGAGRFTEILLGRGANLTSVDLSPAVEANLDNFRGHPRHRIAQANATRLPFEPRSFDVVFCLGVIQHTPSPDATIASLYGQVKPGGWLVIDHYTPNLSNYTKLSEPLVRSILRRLSTEQGVRATEALVDVLLPAHKLASKVPFGQQILSRFSPIRAYYHAYPELNEQQQHEWAQLDTHDALTTWYRHTRTAAELEELLRQLGADDIHTQRANAFVQLRARRPD